jgi:hypothetical protein
MKKLALLFFPFLLAGFLSGCRSSDTAESSTVAQTEIFQDYVLEYENGRVTATATFRFGGPTGTTLSLTSPSRVTYNGIPLSSSKILFAGTVYRFTGAEYPLSATFEFTDTAGKTYTNSIGLAPVEFNPPPPNATRSARLLLPVTRVVKDENTTVELTITDAAGADHSSAVKDGRGVVGFRSSVYFDESQSAVAIEPDFLKEIPAGAVKISLRAEKTQKPAQSTHLGGSISARYHTKPITLTLGG